MSGFCPHDWHQTTEVDLQHMALGSGDYEFAVWEAESSIAPSYAARNRHDRIANAAHKLAEQRGLIPYTAETILRLMDEVEGIPKP